MYFQTVYHGTPHKFDEFSLDAIGTGDGTYPYGTEVVYKVELQGYLTESGTVTLLEDTTMEVDLIKGD